MGVQPQADSAGVQGVEGGRGAGRGRGPCGFSQGEGGGRGGRPTLLSPAERVFAEVRRWVEGRRYERIEAKKAAGEGVLRGLEAEAKVSSLVGWRYIRQALNALRSCAFRNGIREASTRKLLCGQGRDSEEGSEVVSRLSLSFTRRKGDSLPSQKFKRPI
jgi:hypothetical protein